MELRGYVRLLQGLTRFALALPLLCALPVFAGQSALSRWLSDEALPELATVLAEHPRFAGQRIRVVPSSHSGLDEALVTVLVGNLGADERIPVSSPMAFTRENFSSIDALACGGEPDDATLRVTISHRDGRRARVGLELADAGSADTAWRRWEWQGLLSRAEREALSSSGGKAMADGSLAAPWPVVAVDKAAAALGRTLACDLKSQVRDRLVLDWQSLGPATAQAGDVFNASRHLLGQLREIGADDSADIRVEMRVQPFQGDVLQLWLVGSPLRDDFEPVQAVTYIRSASGDSVAETSPAVAAATAVLAPVASQSPSASQTLQILKSPEPVLVPAPAYVVQRPKPGVPARDFFEVQMVDASQSDKGFAGADLAVQLVLVNRGDWPIEYAFSVSGGHYLNCVADPAYFRHDRYGYIEGEVPPGESLTRAITVPDVQHKPNPWFGARKCAGFKDLEGFENFSGKGYKVTEFLRWSL